MSRDSMLDEILKWVKAIGADIYKIKEFLEIESEEEAYKMVRATGTDPGYVVTATGVNPYEDLSADSSFTGLEEDTAEE